MGGVYVKLRGDEGMAHFFARRQPPGQPQEMRVVALYMIALA